MIITITSFKGGVGKTTLAVHLAGYLHHRKKTLLVDGDPNRSGLDWASSGNLPYSVIDEKQAPKHIRDGSYSYIIIDTQVRPDENDLEVLSQGCDLLIIPTMTDALSLKVTLKMLTELKSLDAKNYRLLLMAIPPPPSNEGKEAFNQITNSGLPIFKTMITRYTAFKKAAMQGTLVNQLTVPHSEQSWQSVEKLGREILKI